MALSALGNLKSKFRLGRVRRQQDQAQPAAEGKAAVKEAIAAALEDVQHALDTDDTDAELEAAERPKESVISSFTIAKPKAPVPSAAPAPKKRGRPRKVM